MKKILGIWLTVNVVLIVVLVLLSKERIEVVHAAGGGGGVPAGNGDVNGDGTIDLSDAVYTLTWLFSGGPAPLAIQCPPCFPGRLPATGQTKCYDHLGNEISCADTAFPGQDASYRAGCPVEGRFWDNGDGTLTDNCTGLQWTKAPAIETMTWQQALQYCDQLEFGTVPETGDPCDDWRLPNIRELESLLRFDTDWPYPFIDPAFQLPPFDAFDGQDWTNKLYWSSTSWGWGTDGRDTAWVVHVYGFVVAAGNKELKTNTGGRVLAVRGGI